MKCLCCGREIADPNAEEIKSGWHKRCVRTFSGTDVIPTIDLAAEGLPETAKQSVSGKSTVAGVQKKLSLHISGIGKKSRLTIANQPAGYILKPQSELYSSLPQLAHEAMCMGRACFIQKKDMRILQREQTESGIGTGMWIIMPWRISASCWNGRRRISIPVPMKNVLPALISRNFSLIETAPASREFVLSPAYDLLPVNAVLPEDSEETALTLNGKKDVLLSLTEEMDVDDTTKKTMAELIEERISRL